MPVFGAIIIDPSNFLLLVQGAPMLDWPGTGTACELARVGSLGTMTPAFGSDALIPGTPHYMLTVNVLPGTVSDNFLEQFTDTFLTLRRPWVVSASRSGQPLFNTIKAIPASEGTLSFTVDAQPVRSWQIALRLDVRPTYGAFIVRKPLDAATVREFSPRGNGRPRRIG